MLNITKEEENKNTNHASIYKFDEDSFNCRNAMCIYDILFHLIYIIYHIFKFNSFQIIYVDFYPSTIKKV